jgi:hypothetical protein
MHGIHAKVKEKKRQTLYIVAADLTNARQACPLSNCAYLMVLQQLSDVQHPYQVD